MKQINTLVVFVLLFDSAVVKIDGSAQCPAVFKIISTTSTNECEAFAHHRTTPPPTQCTQPGYIPPLFSPPVRDLCRVIGRLCTGTVISMNISVDQNTTFTSLTFALTLRTEKGKLYRVDVRYAGNDQQFRHHCHVNGTDKTTHPNNGIFLPPMKSPFLVNIEVLANMYKISGKKKSFTKQMVSRVSESTPRYMCISGDATLVGLQVKY